MAKFNISNNSDAEKSLVVDMFPTIASDTIDSLLEYVDETDFSFEIKSVYIYAALLYSSEMLQDRIDEIINEWNSVGTSEDWPLVIRFQEVAEACSKELIGDEYRLTVRNLGLTISGSGNIVPTPVWVSDPTQYTWLLDYAKLPSDLMIGEDLDRRIRYHRETTAMTSDSRNRISDEIALGDGYGAFVVFQFTGPLEGEARSRFCEFMAQKGITTGNGTRIFVGYMRDDSEAEFDEILNAEYVVRLDGYCALDY